VFPELPPCGDFFTNLQPMEPVSKKEPFDSSAHIFQIKWDGVRILALVDQGQVILKKPHK